MITVGTWASKNLDGTVRIDYKSREIPRTKWLKQRTSRVQVLLLVTNKRPENHCSLKTHYVDGTISLDNEKT